MDREHFWTALALLISSEFVLTLSLRALISGSSRFWAYVEFALYLYGSVVITKCLIWRYRDIGKSPWWLVVQYLLNSVGCAGFFVAGLFALASLFGNDVNQTVALISFFGGAAASLTATIWIFVWCLLPSSPRPIVSPEERSTLVE
jgi:uncharacterized membrane protein YhaH (DUF805 family)